MADTLDVISLTTAKLAINMKSTNTDHDTELARQITAISRLMDKRVGPVVQRTITTEIHETDGEDIALHWSPVTSITTVREDRGGDITVLTAHAFGGTSDGYFAEPDWRDPTRKSGVIQRRYDGRRGRWPCGAMVEVTYVAGRYADTASVDPRFAECAGEILRRLWKRESGVWAQSSSILENLAADGADATPSPGFFKVADPRITEMLGDELGLQGIA